MSSSVQAHMAIVIPYHEGCKLTLEQAGEIYNEFQTWVQVRRVRAGQAKRLGADRQCRILSMCGLHNNFDGAYARAMEFIDINRRLGGLPVGGATGDVALDNNTGNVSDEPGEDPIYARANSRAGESPP